MSAGFSRITISGLHGRGHADVEFQPGLNVIHGKNGTGKTTVLHIASNILEKDWDRFFHIKFTEISAVSLSGQRLIIRRIQNDAKNLLSISIGELSIELERDFDFDLTEKVDDAVTACFGSESIYLPAFRVILDAANNGDERFKRMSTPSGAASRIEREREFIFRRNRKSERTKIHRAVFPGQSQPADSATAKTIMCRSFFGRFVPIIRYPSIEDLETEMMNEMFEARYELSVFDRESTASTFVKVFETIYSSSKISDNNNIHELVNSVKIKVDSMRMNENDAHRSVYARITKVLSQVERDTLTRPEMGSALKVFNDALSEREKREAFLFDVLNRFVSSSNRFLQGKAIVIPNEPQSRAHRSPPMLEIAGQERAPLTVLSSGERHLVTMLFSATHMTTTNGVVLIDEPELSLHVEWQRSVLSEMIRQSGDRQTIACTHAPEVVADHQEALRAIQYSQVS